MTRDKQIEEMEKEIKKMCDEKPADFCNMYECHKCLATDLYNAGYRKASEVALAVIGEVETLANRQIDILNEIEPIDPRTFGGGKHAFEMVLKTLAELKKKYTEEGK